MADIEKRRRVVEQRISDAAEAVGLVGCAEEELAPQLQSWVEQ